MTQPYKSAVCSLCKHNESYILDASVIRTDMMMMILVCLVSRVGVSVQLRFRFNKLLQNLMRHTETPRHALISTQS